MEKWNCDNGCDFVGYPGDFFQMASPEGTHLMLVCKSCAYELEDEGWTP